MNCLLVAAGLSAATLNGSYTMADETRIENMMIIESNDIELATQSFGAEGDPTVLLVMGATASMLGWPDGFCEALAANGLRVVRFDHRDTGRSTTVPPGEAAYTVEGMAGDVVAVMDAQGLETANLVGMSLGGLLSQIVALDHADRVRTLTLIASEPLGWDGDPLPHIAPAFMEHFGTIADLDWSDADAVTDFLVEIDRLSSGTNAPFDAQWSADRARRVLERSESPVSMFNHASVAAAEDWTGRFREISQPVLVIHGSEDPVLPLPNGQALAAGIPDAELLDLNGVGHELPAAAWQPVAEAIARTVTADRN